MARVVVALGAALLLALGAPQAAVAQEIPADEVPVVVAAREMPRSTVLGEADIAVMHTRRKMCPLDALVDVESVLGRELVVDVRQAEVLTLDDFVRDPVADAAAAARRDALLFPRSEWDQTTASPTPAFSGMSVSAARALARDEGRLLVLDFSAEWCGPCKHMEKTTWRDERVLAWVRKHAVVVQVDVDELPAISHAMEIEAMPTVVAERDGREVSRHRGMLAAGPFLTWLEAAASGIEPIPEDLLDVQPVYDDVPDEGAREPMTRLAAAVAMVRDGRHDEALSEVSWLWVHGETVRPGFLGVKWLILSNTMRLMAEAHDPSRERFERFLAAAQHEIDADHVGLVSWSDWVALCGVLGEEDRLHAWYLAHREPDGSVDGGRYAMCEWIAEALFTRFTADGRYAEAGRLYRRPSAPFEKQLAMLDMLLDPPIDGATRTSMQALMVASGAVENFHEELRKLAARTAATLIAAERDEEALALSRLLLSRVDDAASRKALVERALEWAHPLPEHARWYAEALEMGADVEGLETRLEHALRLERAGAAPAAMDPQPIEPQAGENSHP